MSTSPGLRYLIVDDHAPMRGILRALLTGQEDEVWEAADGAEAQSIYELRLPDWVIMEIQMSPVNGLEATRRITARHPGARVVMVTQYDDPDLDRHAREAGAMTCLAKDNLQAVHRFVHAPNVAHA